MGRENVGRSETGEWDRRKPAKSAAEHTLPRSGDKCQINNFVGIYMINSRGEARCEKLLTENGGKDLIEDGDELPKKATDYVFYAEERELVIAFCSEDASWVDEWAPFYHRVTVYSKCGRNLSFQSPNVEVLFLANIGACDHAFLTYVVTRYDNLPGRVSFSKGVEHGLLLVTDPRLDTKFYIECRRTRNQEGGGGGEEEEEGGSGADDLLKFNLSDYRFSNNPSDREELRFVRSGYQNLGEWVDLATLLTREMFRESYKSIRLAGWFSASREQIRNMPVRVYDNLLRQQKFANEEVGHYIERSWGPMFCTTHPPKETY